MELWNVLNQNIVEDEKKGGQKKLKHQSDHGYETISKHF
jgi:hypothetical protein